MRNKVLLMILSLFLGCTLIGLPALAAPEKGTIVTGKITFDDGEPAAGAYVMVVGTTKGTTADKNGKYSIDVSMVKEPVLEFQFMGFKTVTINVGSRNKIDIVLKPSNTQLEEVVMVGYGSGVQRKDLTGSISSVSGRDIAITPKATLTEALQGRMAGVQITTADGDVDVQTNIRVRGGTSITNSNEPLLIVDGFQVSDISNISPSNIQSVDVLKDASATAIYGARGANGVVVITTKNAVDGAAKVSFNAYYQVNTLAKKMDLLDVYEFILWNYEMDQLSTRTSAIEKYGYPDDYYIYKKYGKGYDWQAETYGKPAGTQYYNASISGGTKATSYIANLGYTYRDGVQGGTNYQRANADLKINHTISKNLHLRFNINYSSTINQGVSFGIINSLMYHPTAGIREYSWSPDVEWGDEFDEDYGTEQDELSVTNITQGYQRQLDTQRKKVNDVLKGSVNLKWTILDNLVFDTSFRGTLGNQRSNTFYGPATSQAMYSYGGKAAISMYNGNSSQYMVTNTLNYKLKRDIHNLNILVGHEFVNSSAFSASNTFTDFPDNITADVAYANTALGKSVSHNSAQEGNSRLMSFFARANYAIGDKYLFTLTMRADQSNKFAKGHRWGYFPAGAFAWRISNENFMKDAKWINDMKLRVSYGSAGNNRIGDELYRMTYKVSADSYVPQVGDSVLNTYIPASSYMINPNLKWETTISRNIGIDFSLFKHRLSGTIEGYWNTTKDLLVPSQIPAYTGYVNVLSNYGQTSNKGVEFSLKASLIRKRNMLLDFNFNITYNENRIDHLADGEDYWLRSSKWSNYQKEPTDFYINVGGSVGQFYGYVTDGMYTVDDFDFIDGNYVLKEGVADCTSILNYQGKLLPGMLKLKKLSGEGNVVNADEDRIIIGSNVPKFQGGFGLDFTWKNFDVSAFFNYMLGFQTFNAAKVALTSVGYYGHRNLLSIADSKHRFRYFDDNGNSLLGDPEALKEFNKNATMWSPNMYSHVVHSWAVEDASFLRLNNLTIGYTLPKYHSKKIGMSQLRFYLTGANLFCLTNYSGFDPEINVQRGLTPGIDYKTYPRSRSYTLGVNITF